MPVAMGLGLAGVGLIVAGAMLVQHARAIERHTRSLIVAQWAIERMAAACDEDGDGSWLSLELRVAAERMEKIRDGKA